MIAPHAIQRHPSNAQPRLRVLHSGCRRACWAMMMRQARRSSAIQHYTVRCGFLSQRSYVAPSRQRRSSSKRPRKELTYCPIYGFKSFLICAKELTPALFVAKVCLSFHRYTARQHRHATYGCVVTVDLLLFKQARAMRAFGVVIARAAQLQENNRVVIQTSFNDQ